MSEATILSHYDCGVLSLSKGDAGKNKGANSEDKPGSAL
jgi:hypothetical protein